MLVARPLAANNKAIATCANTDVVGDLVYVSGPFSGAYYVVEKIDVTNYAKMPAIGSIIFKLTATRCVVQTDGDVVGIYAALQPGKIYFAGSTGQPTLTAPAPPLAGRAHIQPIGVAIDTDVLKLKFDANLKVRIG